MIFSVLPVGSGVPSSGESAAYLISDDWDDWFKYSTLFHLYVFDSERVLHSIGDVKIGQFGMREAQRRAPDLPPRFKSLGKSQFSLGQDDSYYEALNELGGGLRDTILASLRDLAADPDLFESVLGEDVVTDSILRFVTASTVRGQFRRMARGGVRLSGYRLRYEPPVGSGSASSVALSFKVEPDSMPPTNIHVLVGRNGVGKTFLLGKMTDAVMCAGDAKARGVFTSEQSESTPIANLVSVSFSAFDEFDIRPNSTRRPDGVGYNYVGLRRTADTGAGLGTPKSPEMLTKEFADSLHECLFGTRQDRWRRAINALQVDPGFKDAEVASLASSDCHDTKNRAAALFKSLSSGHKIILLTITRLVELVEERTLVMVDEPEAHLHPPLLAAFIRALSDLLVQRNGVAIIATHSPVVLQEVPRDCVWILRRSGCHTTSERPDIETFGENVGVLTQEVFGLELTQSGFHALLSESVARRGTYEAVADEFCSRLGAEARAVVRAIVAARASGEAGDDA